MKVVRTGTSVPIEQFERESVLSRILEVANPILQDGGIPDATARLAAEMLYEDVCVALDANKDGDDVFAAAITLNRCGSDEMRTAVLVIYTAMMRDMFYLRGRESVEQKPKFSFLGRRR